MIAAQRQVRVLVSPLLLRTSHALRRLPQQEPKQRIALLTDVAQPPAVGTGVLTGNQSQIAGHLFAATKPSRGTKDQHKGQRRDRPHARMGLQPLHLRHPRSFFLDRLAQLIDARVEAVQQFEQFLPAPSGPGRQPQRLQCARPFPVHSPRLRRTPSFMAIACN